MTVTWRDIARKDFEDVVRSKLLWGSLSDSLVSLYFSLSSGTSLVTQTKHRWASCWPGWDSSSFSSSPDRTDRGLHVDRRGASVRELARSPELSLLAVRRGDWQSSRTQRRRRSDDPVRVSRGDHPRCPLSGDVAVVELAQVTGITIGLGVTFTAIAVGISAATSSRELPLHGSLVSSSSCW